jgi:histone acetyltransferase 1
VVCYGADSDYTKSLHTFQNLVDSDATTFKPLGDKLGSYVHRTSKGKGKGKGKSKNKEGEGVTFEMYKVRAHGAD